MAGKLWGIGVGPGDPDLITVKAVKVLAQTQVVCVPTARKGKPSLALAIAREHLHPRARIVELLMPMTGDTKQLENAWEQAVGIILEYLHEGLDVAFLTLGDPSLYSTYSYVNNALQNRDNTIETEVIPGITSFSAAAARTGIPLASGDEPLIVLPSSRELEWALEPAKEANVVLMKISSDYQGLVAELEKKSRLDGAVLVSRAGQPEEYVTKDLEALLDKKVDYLSLIISKP